MLTNPTLEKLEKLRLYGMAKCVEEQFGKTDYDDLTFEERIGIMVDREIIEHENRRLRTRLKQAKLRQQACLEDIDYRQRRGLDKSLVKSLETCKWINDHLNVLVTGPCGAGKSFIACALGHRACMEGYKVFYTKASRLFERLALARGDGRYARIMENLAKRDLIIIDDWGLSTLTDQESKDLFEILEDRHDNRSTVIAGQLPIEHWHDTIKNPALADAVMDRLVHNAYKIQLTGESMRKVKSQRL